VVPKIDFSEFLKCMDGDYARKMDLSAPMNFDIRVVAKEFIKLSIS